MVVLIENLKDGRYMGVASHWGPKNDAYDFRTPAFAIDFCIMHRLRNVRIIVDVGDPANSIVLVVQGAEEMQNQELSQVHTGLKKHSNGSRDGNQLEKRSSTRRKRTRKTRDPESQIETVREPATSAVSELQ
jgi:hypothetical protein